MSYMWFEKELPDLIPIITGGIWLLFMVICFIIITIRRFRRRRKKK